MVPKHLGTLGKPGRRDMDACAGGGVSQTATAGGGAVLREGAWRLQGPRHRGPQSSWRLVRPGAPLNCRVPQLCISD